MILLSQLKRLFGDSARPQPAVDPIYLQTFEMARVGLVHIGTDGRILRANAAMREMLGYDENEMLGRPLSDFISEECRDQMQADFLTLTSGERPFYDSARTYLKKSGERVAARALGTVIGDPPILLTVVEDITNYHVAEAALRASEERFELAMRGSDEGLFDWRVPENSTYLSPRWKSMLGYADHELPNDTGLFPSLVAPGVMETINEQLRRIEAREIDTYEVEIKLRHREGFWLDVLSRGFPVFDADHNIVRLVGTHQDITQRKRQEAQLRLASTVFDTTHEGIAVTDFSGVIELVNPAFETLTGYNAQEVKGRNISLLKSGRQDGAFYAAFFHEIQTKGLWRGEMWNRRKDGRVHPFWVTVSVLRDAHGEPAGYIALYSDVSEFKRSQARLEFLALHDSETGLANRFSLLRSLDVTLEQLEREGGGAALFHLDLDRFRIIVESLGHAVGEELLQQSARRFAACLSPRDLLARIGSDEYAILRPACSSAEDARSLADALVQAMDEPFVFASGAKAYCGVNVGMVWFAKGQSDADILMRQADSALHAAKESGRVRSYEPRQLVEARERLEMEIGLRRALERGEFALQFQPLIDLQDERTFGVEALVRWRAPEGIVPPIRFISLAEKTGLIVPIGEWVMRCAAERMKAWLDAGAALDTLSINLSPRQFERPDLAERVATILTEAGLGFDKVELEITESVLMNQKDAVAKLEQLRALGLRVSVDDFGTGHSSLAYLKDFPIDKLKLDRAFIKDLPGDETGMRIAEAVIRLGHSLGLTVLAEGVETTAQADFLARAGCRYAQGFLFAKPMWDEELLPFLNRARSVAA